MWRQLATCVAAIAIASTAHAEPTPVTVHVISQDGKYIGDTMGGAEVILRDVESGTILARGVTRGGTGNTAQIMEAEGRSPIRATPDAAGFETTLDLSRPTLVRLEARGPLAHPASQLRVSAERWLIPGQRLDAGNGWTIEMPGLVVSLITDPGRPRAGSRLEITAHVQLMCGCPITRGGIWDADDYEVTALVYRKGKLLTQVPLSFESDPGRFAGIVQLGTQGHSELIIAAHNRKTGNSGLVVHPIQIVAASPKP
ncbi:hypothetical protein [Sphingopyxis sp. 550A]